MPPADIPDFDSMSPEEVMAWMESLAKRQGAHEGFTTAADVEIEEIDPDSVEIDEPGYVPFGEESSPKPAAAKPAEPPPAAPPPPAPPELPEIPEMLPGMSFDEEETQPAPTFEMGGMAWLESLAADQGSDFPQIDLSSLSEALGTAPASEEAANPIEWLESMANDAEEAPDITELETAGIPELSLDDDDFAGIEDPLAAGIDPMAWLESLAKRQGVKDEELTTAADIKLPAPTQAPEPDLSASFTPQIPREETTNPAAWLESLSAEQAMPAQDAAQASSMTDEDIQYALARGVEIPRDEMAAFLDRQLQRQLEGGEFIPPDADYDPDAPAEKAELPDWLLEQVQPPEVETEPPALLDEIIEPPDVADLPDWLREDTGIDETELDNIFAPDPVSPPVGLSGTFSAVEMDTDDPWVVAFDEESQADPDQIPEWYARNLSDPERIAAVEKQAGSELEAAVLEPETELTAGELEPGIPDWLRDAMATGEEMEAVMIPDWLSADASEDISLEPAAEIELPDWLRAADTVVEAAEVPDWLRETMDEEDAAASAPAPAAQAEPTPTVSAIPSAPPVQAMSPVPVPAMVNVDVEATLAQARRHISSGNVAGGLIEYESIIRANKALDLVVNDLTQLVEQHKDNPAVYRVLGDGLMRQGKLQGALDTYRRALNQL